MNEKIRIASLKMENLEDTTGQKVTMEQRIAIMKLRLNQLRADIICLQGVSGQKMEGESRKLLTLKKMLIGTPYKYFNMVSTMTADGSQVYEERNLVVLSRFDVIDFHQCKHEYVSAPFYRKATASPTEEEANKVEWERPVFHVKLALPNDKVLHVINLELKSYLPVNIRGQKQNQYRWKSAAGWAEGFYLSSMKRVGQALETRVLVDKLFDEDEHSLIAVCGDFNSTSNNVPVQALRGDVEYTGNGLLANRVLIPCEQINPELFDGSPMKQGKGPMLDHLLVSRQMLAYYEKTEFIQNNFEVDAMDNKSLQSHHAPVIAEFFMP
ncbi:MAG: hypothetical protein ACEPOZ_10935 [Marinifilaceae bacterium]